MATDSAPTIGFVSLGCPKATVDSERILTQLRIEGYAFADSFERADLAIVNTCGFIEQAVAESEEAIAEALERTGRVIVTGCLGADARRLRARFPDLLAVTGPQDYEGVMRAVHEVLPPPARDPMLDLVPASGVKLTPRHYAWLKIAEGCNHRCTFCIIPRMRGPLVSRPIGEVVREARALAGDGVRELLVIAQDTSAYGVDLNYRTDFVDGRPVRTRLVELVRELGTLGVWVRLHYLYPYPHVDELIPLMREGLALPYLDVPLQHASSRVLAAMRRPGSQERMLERIQSWREACPGLVIRSTFIVGFPGERERDFLELLEFLRAARLDRVGAFAYSNIEGAAANRLEGHLPEAEKQARLAELMRVQEEISREKLAERVGAEMRVLVDEVHGDTAIGRSYADAPEIDGVVRIRQAGHLSPGEFAWVRITGSDAHDLSGEPVE